MPSIFSRLIRVSFTTLQSSSSSSFSPSPSRHILLGDLHHVKWCHGIPDIPNDGKVVRLKNSKTGSDVYLVGTIHVSIQSAETVWRVINFVRPDAVAVELCQRRAIALQKWKPENYSVYRVFLNTMRAPCRLPLKICLFILNLWYRRFQADGIIPGQEFKVAIEQSLRVNAKCFVIDQDFGVTLQQLSKILSFNSLKRLLIRAWDQSKQLEQGFEQLEQGFKSITNFSKASYTSLTRSSVREITGFMRKTSPEICKVIIDDRDKLMFTRLRRVEGKVVAVVGLGHMDGIERLWKLAEDDDDN